VVVWSNRQTGGATTNGAGFDPANASFATDLAATSANTLRPVVTSATYNFAARTWHGAAASGGVPA